MDERILDISDEAVGLRLRLSQLVLSGAAGETTIPLEEIAAVVISHPAVHYSHAALAGLCEAGAAVVLCNDKRLPIGTLLPLTGNSLQAERFAMQASAGLPTRKALWQQIIKSKIRAQSTLLIRVTGEDCGLSRLTLRVRSGDPENIEGQASRRYWPALFGSEFHRVPQAADPVNRCLNYGYAVLRAITCRAICGSGLHPSLGLHHHNRYNAFCLADDLMEPFRPSVDAIVLSLWSDFGPGLPLDRETKARLLGELMTHVYPSGKNSRSLFDTLTRLTASLVRVLSGNAKKLALPD